MMSLVKKLVGAASAALTGTAAKSTGLALTAAAGIAGTQALNALKLPARPVLDIAKLVASTGGAVAGESTSALTQVATGAGQIASATVAAGVVFPATTFMPSLGSLGGGARLL